MLLTERRRTRSRPSEAIDFLLQHAKERLGVPAIALGTPSGFLVVGAGYDVDAPGRRGAAAALKLLACPRQ